MFQDNYFFNALPLVLIIAYIAIFHTHTTFLITALLSPLSVNLGGVTEGQIGLFLPSDPILFGLMLLIIFKELKSSSIDNSFWKVHISIFVVIYIACIF